MTQLYKCGCGHVSFDQKSAYAHALHCEEVDTGTDVQLPPHSLKIPWWLKLGIVIWAIWLGYYVGMHRVRAAERHIETACAIQDGKHNGPVMVPCRVESICDFEGRNGCVMIDWKRHKTSFIGDEPND